MSICVAKVNSDSISSVEGHKSLRRHHLFPYLTLLEPAFDCKIDSISVERGLGSNFSFVGPCRQLRRRPDLPLENSDVYEFPWDVSGHI